MTVSAILCFPVVIPEKWRFGQARAEWVECKFAQEDLLLPFALGLVSRMHHVEQLMKNALPSR